MLTPKKGFKFKITNFVSRIFSNVESNLLVSPPSCCILRRYETYNQC